MKSLQDYLLRESKSQLKQIKGTPEELLDIIKQNIMNYSDDEGDLSTAQYKKWLKLLTDFLKDAKALSFESSEAEFYNYENGNDLVTQNDNVEKDVFNIENDYDWQEEDYCSLKVKGDTLLLSSQTNSYMNGDYFNLKITKYK